MDVINHHGVLNQHTLSFLFHYYLLLMHLLPHSQHFSTLSIPSRISPLYNPCSWLTSLTVGSGVHLSVLEGEGGYYPSVGCDCEYEASTLLHPLSLCPPPLTLSQDRLRNGETLCDLVCALESAAAGHVKLSSLIHRSVRARAISLAGVFITIDIPPLY